MSKARATTRLLILAAVALVTACSGGDAPTAPLSSPVGIWRMRTKNGNVMPYSYSPLPGASVTWTSVVLTIGADHSWSEVENVAVVGQNGSEIDTVVTAGTWAESGAAFTFTDTKGLKRRVTVNGGTLIEDVNSESNYFER